METLLSKEETAKLYKIAKPNEKKLLEKLHKKEDLIIPPGPLTEWGDIAKFYKMHPVNSLPFPKPKNDREKRMNAHWVMDIMTDYFNTDPATNKLWLPTYPGNGGVRVWYEYKTSVGFVFLSSDLGGDFTCLGSRLHFKDHTIAKLAATALQKYQNQLFNFSK